MTRQPRTLQPGYTVGVRLPPHEYEAMEQWRQQQQVPPTISMTIRHLIRVGLKASKTETKVDE